MSIFFCSYRYPNLSDADFLVKKQVYVNWLGIEQMLANVSMLWTFGFTILDEDDACSASENHCLAILETRIIRFPEKLPQWHHRRHYNPLKHWGKWHYVCCWVLSGGKLEVSSSFNWHRQCIDQALAPVFGVNVLLQNATFQPRNAWSTVRCYNNWREYSTSPVTIEAVLQCFSLSTFSEHSTDMCCCWQQSWLLAFTALCPLRASRPTCLVKQPRYIYIIRRPLFKSGVWLKIY